MNNEHHADQVMLRALLQRGAATPGTGEIQIHIIGQPICQACSAALFSDGGIQALHEATGRRIVVTSREDPEQNRAYPPPTECG